MMSVRIGIDLGIFTTLAQKNGPTPLEEIAATKNAEPLFTGNFKLKVSRAIIIR